MIPHEIQCRVEAGNDNRSGSSTSPYYLLSSWSGSPFCRTTTGTPFSTFAKISRWCADCHGGLPLKDTFLLLLVMLIPNWAYHFSDLHCIRNSTQKTIYQGSREDFIRLRKRTRRVMRFNRNGEPWSPLAKASSARAHPEGGNFLYRSTRMYHFPEFRRTRNSIRRELIEILKRIRRDCIRHRKKKVVPRCVLADAVNHRRALSEASGSQFPSGPNSGNPLDHSARCALFSRFSLHREFH